ncbi:hypothetical protein SCMU_07370 [Sinomonas cyclohexanicum]|uniref:ABC3 transporter permease C-terminal domain-containing protein n=1 Tax=Sinomonas cyclohexanicum TaxID=322009 RepID=A0ABN6FD87_SINCY|nr:FtsX-like permease family protein [Corynebacterium cyclohexanicum]BCT74895.1 hypothetical protein SCMU_07370 [Corynebacterium cyclohexanicum]
MRGVDALDPVFAGKFRLTGGAAPLSDADALATPGFLATVDAAIGDTVSTGFGAFRVTGTIAQTGTSPDVPELFVAPSLVPEAGSRSSGGRDEYYVAGAAPVAWDRVLELNRAGITVLDRNLVLDPPQAHSAAPARTPAQLAANFSGVAFVGALALLQVGLLAGAAFAVGARRQARELHVLAAVGAAPRDLLRVTLAGAAVLGAGAAVLGGAVGTGGGAAGAAIAIAAGSTAFTGVHPNVLMAIGAGGLGFVACLIAAVAPARSAGRAALRSAMGAPPATSPSRRVAAVGAAVVGSAAIALVAAGTLPRLLGPDEWDGATALTGGLAACGAVVAVVGTVLLLPRIVHLVARPGDWLPAPLRMALRDAARNRQRAVPAVAACVAVTALAAAVMLPSAGANERAALTYPWQANGNQAFSWVLEKGPTLDEVVAASRAAGGEPTAWRTVSRPAVAGCGTAGEHDAMVNAAYVQEFGRQGPCETTWLMIAPGQACPRTGSGAVIDRGDLRCAGTDGAPKTLAVGNVDDLALLLGRRPSQAAVSALDGGGVVALDAAVFDDGHARVGVQDVASVTRSRGAPPDLQPRATLDAVLEPAHFGAAGIVSPETARTLGILAQPWMHVVQLASPPPADFVARAADGLTTAAAPYAAVSVERGPDLTTAALMLWLLVGGAALVALAGASITTGLALADGRRDSMTLAEVGAAPGFRKRYAAALAGVTVGLGTLLGAAIGLASGAALVGSFGGGIPIVVPWGQLAALVVAIPVLAAAIAWCVTRAGYGERRRALER